MTFYATNIVYFRKCSSNALFNEQFSNVQDVNSPIHRARFVQLWFEEREDEVVRFRKSSQFEDLNIIESLFLGRFVDESDVLSNLFSREISNLTAHNNSHGIDTLRLFTVSSEVRSNGPEIQANHTLTNQNNLTKRGESELSLSKSIVDNTTDIFSNHTNNGNATEPKFGEMANDPSDEMLLDGNPFFLNRFGFDGFPEFPWIKRSKRNDSSSFTNNTNHNVNKRFTFFRRFIFI
ncbi:hypothetical protein CDAR_558301 [Caerostris darwini]|uniref:Uncharacterized protein n=1 Tax=Caerostris darwini TaxID=1538125 RepID=A0AAV4R8Z4_9ARAC|nr:hypothetical protein CDAR_558301 [Caerostris darwini]